MPYANPNELPAPTREALPKKAQSIFVAAFNSAYEGTCKDSSDREACANKIAWSAVGKAYKKTESGEWTELSNIESVCSEPTGISSFHDVRLQRLDVFMDYGGTKVLHTLNHFNNAANWERIPVIFQKTGAGVPGVHPDFDAVTTRSLNPEKYVNVGYIENPHISGTGEPSLMGRVAFSNPECSLMAKAGKLSLSTGFAAPTRLLEDGRKEIAGDVVPNHVLIFKRGSCPNCYPNDNGAQFLNISPDGDDEMDDESKGILKEVRDYLTNLAKKPPVTPAETIMSETPKTEEFANILAERDTLKAKVEELTNLTASFKKANDEAKTAFENIQKENQDLKWTLLKPVLPHAWTDTPEHETASREKWTNTPAVFVAELAAFKNQLPADKPAEGEKMTNVDQSGEDGFGVIGYKKETK